VERAASAIPIKGLSEDCDCSGRLVGEGEITHPNFMRLALDPRPAIKLQGGVLSWQASQFGSTFGSSLLKVASSRRWRAPPARPEQT
jgi:hypothetical protein